MDSREDVCRREIKRNCVFLSELAEEIQLTEDFSTETPTKLARLVGETARLLAECVSVAPADSLGEINVFLGKITAHLRYVERAKILQTPWSVIRTVEYFFKDQTRSTADFIIRPTWSYNYSLIGDFWSFYREILGGWSWFPLDRLKRAAKLGDDDAIYCVSFPRTEQLNCLLHANWGHEVGHIIAGKWIEENFPALWKSVEPAISKKIHDSIVVSPPPVDPLFKDIAILDLTASQTLAAMEVAKRGITELLCDVIGVHLFGVSALCAAFEFSARYLLDVSPLQCDYYPPWRYRIREMIAYCESDLKALRTVGDPRVFSPFLGWLDEARKVSSTDQDLIEIGSKTVTREAYQFIKANWDSIKREAIAMLPAASARPYSLTEKAARIRGLIGRLESSVPPNETSHLGTPADLQDIIASSWVYKMARISGDLSWGTADDFDLMFRLVLKGIESSQIQKHWGSKLAGDDA